MKPLSFPHQESADQLLDQLRTFVAAVSALSDLELLEPALCRGWSRLDTVVHVRMGIEEMLTGCASQVETAPDHDAASYWAGHPDDRDQDLVPHILWLRRTASAYGRPSAVVRHLEDLADRTTGVLTRMPIEPVRFQGKVLDSGDFLATWVVELAVHHLDLDGASPHPTPASVGLARRTLEALAGHALPHTLDDEEAILVGLGRTPTPAGVAPSPHFPVSL